MSGSRAGVAAKTGPPKTRTKKDLEAIGSKRAKNTPEEPIVSSKKPKPPVTLSPEEREVWDETVADLGERQLLSSSHAKSIAIFCRLWVEYEKLSVQINKEGVVITKFHYDKKTGEPIGQEEIPNPLAVRRQEVANQLYKYGWNMGWTPLSNLQLKPLKTETGSTGKKRFFTK